MTSGGGTPEEIVWDDRLRALRAACEWRRVNPDPRHQDPGNETRSKYAGGHRIRVTPVPIPNTEVKPDTADGTAWETVWESRSLPAVIPRPDVERHRAFFCLRRQRASAPTVSHGKDCVGEQVAAGSHTNKNARCARSLHRALRFVRRRSSATAGGRDVRRRRMWGARGPTESAAAPRLLGAAVARTRRRPPSSMSVARARAVSAHCAECHARGAAWRFRARELQTIAV